MEQISLLDNLTRTLDDKNLVVKDAPPVTDIEESSTYLFISFDLVNSTSFKSIYPSGWPIVFRRFYELMEDKVLKSFVNSRVWRYVGDEVLFFKKVTSYKELFSVPKEALNIVRSVIGALHLSFPIVKNQLFIKSTLWLAKASYIPPETLALDSKLPIDNLIIYSDHNDKRNIDFLGADIDLGFRISEFAYREKVIISAELAFLLYKAREDIEESSGYNVEETIRIVSYERLKGIWGERHYPIIWYYDNWDDREKMFVYDEHFKSDIINRLKNGEFNDDMKIKRLKKIFSDLGIDDKIEEIINSFKNEGLAGIHETIIASTSQYNKVEVHCVAVCFNNDGKVLIGKRPESKRRFPGKWEFGCGQLKQSQDFKDCLKQSYLEDFGALLEFYEELTPVSSYTIDDKKEHRKIPGIIFIARVINADEIRRTFSKEVHSEIDWFDPSKLDAINEDEFVNDFKTTVLKAVSAWEKIKGAM